MLRALLLVSSGYAIGTTMFLAAYDATRRTVRGAARAVFRTGVSGALYLVTRYAIYPAKEIPLTGPSLWYTVFLLMVGFGAAFLLVLEKFDDDGHRPGGEDEDIALPSES